MIIIFNILLWIVGIVGDDSVEDRIIARGKCRDIMVKNTEVKIKFTDEEDAKLFAEDLKLFLELKNGS